MNLDDWLVRGVDFPWSAPALLHSTIKTDAEASRRRALATGTNAHSAVAMAMSGTFGTLDQLEIEIESGVITLRGRDIARAAGLPGRPSGTGR